MLAKYANLETRSPNLDVKSHIFYPNKMIEAKISGGRYIQMNGYYARLIRQDRKKIPNETGGI